MKPSKCQCPEHFKRPVRNNPYQNEQLEYFQGSINRLRNSVEDRQTRIPWQSLKEVRIRKSTSKTKQKSVGQEEKYRTKKNISRICLGTSLKSPINI